MDFNECEWDNYDSGYVFFTHLNCWAIKGDDFPPKKNMTPGFGGTGFGGTVEAVVIKFTQINHYHQ